MILNQLRIALEVLVAKRRSRSRGLGGRRLGQLVEELPAALRFPVELKRPNAKIAEDVGWIAACWQLRGEDVMDWYVVTVRQGLSRLVAGRQVA